MALSTARLVEISSARSASCPKLVQRCTLYASIPLDLFAWCVKLSWL